MPALVGTGHVRHTGHMDFLDNVKQNKGTSQTS